MLIPKVPGSKDSKALINDGVVSGDLTIGDIDTFVFEASAGDAVHIRAAYTSGSQRIEAWLYSPDGTLIRYYPYNDTAEFDCYVSSSNCQINQTGIHRLVVADYGSDDTGNYEISFSGSLQSSVTPSPKPDKPVIPPPEIDKSKAIRLLSETSYSFDHSENHDNDWVNTFEDSGDSDLITHALYPFQRDGEEYNSGNAPGYSWSLTQSNILDEFNSNNSDTEDTTRIPLILIHGWQANCRKPYLFKIDYLDTCKDGSDSDAFPNRDPDNLANGRDNNDYNAEEYWDTFLRYFAATDALKQRYKLYLYQYPTYKHVTFNARMLARMLPEIDYLKNWLESPGKKITFLTHSMGGLVARSLLEEHDGAQVLKDNEWKPLLNTSDGSPPGARVVEKLITLDTPHHGSPAPIPAWIDTDTFDNDVAFDGGKDLFSPGAMDLWWDGYDKAFTTEIVQKDLNDNEAKDYNVADQDNSFRTKGLAAFDNLYRIKKPEFSDSFLVSFGKLDIVKTGIFYYYPNPWLTNLNKKHFKHHKVWRDKYILYSGYNDNDIGHSDWANRLADTGNNGFADNTWGAGVYEVGYINSAPAPVTSALFDWDENEARDEMVDVSNIEGWPSKNEVALFGVFLADENKNILRTERNGYKIRFLRDYHHDRMLNGAYYTDAPKHRLIKSPFICDDNGLLEDLKLNNSFYTGFRSGENRQAYVQEATGENYPFKLFSVNCKNTDKDSQWLSTLDYDPLFLLIKQDLLGNDEYRTEVSQ
ncbi:hypothetical protein BMR11_10185 [Methylococcaceae bacterium CS5]|nr:hypothetical protein BMR11_10185 [Methylococcaceae bacterium CS5]